MSQNIRLKRSSVPGRVPNVNSLELGEIAINTYDGKLYLKQDVSGDQSVVAVGETSSLAISASHANNADNAVLSSFAASASYANNATSASYALTASYTPGAGSAVSASYAATASSADNFTVRGTLTAQTIVAQTITSSTEFVTGSTKFGSLQSNNHQFTGSVSISGSLSINGINSAFTSASFNTRILNDSASIALLSGSYLTDSASFNTRISNNSSSIASLSGSYLTASSSFDARILNSSGSIALLSGSYLASSASFNSSIGQLLNFSASLDATYATDDELNSATASLSSSISNLSDSYLASSASFDTRISASNASVALLSGSYLASSASFNTRITNNSASIAQLSSSFNNFSGSYNTGSFTGSFHGTFTGSLDNLRNTDLGHIPFFSSSQVLADSIARQIDNGSGSYSIAINQNGVTAAAPEALYVWQPSSTSWNVISGKGNLNNYLQLNIQNTNAGDSASSDIVATANNGDENSNFIDIGINNENFVGSVGGANDAYLYSTGQHLHIGNASNQYVGFFAGGLDVDANMKLLLNPNNQHEVTGSLNVTEGVTASLHGTASWANNAINATSASYWSGSIINAATASYVLNAVSSSYALTASYAANVPLTASHALNADTASYVQNAETASYVLNAVSSSYALTASYWSGSILNATSASHADNASTASYVQNAQSASYVQNAQSASYVQNAHSASYVQNAQTASYVLNAISSSYAATASSADDFTVRGTLTAQTINVQTITSSVDFITGSSINGTLLSNTHQFTGSVDVTGSLTVNGSTAITSDQTSSMSVSNADLAITASYVTNAQSASYWSGSIINAATASYVQNAQSASYWSGSILNATSASYADNAVTASYVIQAQSASYWSGSILNATSASHADNATTASYVQNAQSASYWSGSILNATSASHADNATTASYAISASFASNASTASYVQNAQTASYVLNAVSSSYAANADLLDGKDSTIFATTGSNVFVGNQTVTGSLLVSGSTTQIGNNTLTGNTTLSGSIAISGSQIFTGISTQIGNSHFTGSMNISGSTTQVGNNNLFGNTTLSGSIIISGSHELTNPSIKLYGDTETNGAIKFLPVTDTIDDSITGSYVYVSGSTSDLYFTQNGAGFANTTRLRWLEGNLYTGLLNGGLITAATGSTTFNVSSGSGVIVNLNASLSDNPYPTIQYVNWGNLTNQPLTYLTSSIQTFVAINSSGSISQQTTAFNDGQYNTLITIGTVLHQNKSTVNASITYPNVAYGFKQRSYDFLKAFGPLKLSGLTINTSSSLGLTVGSGTAFADGRNYQVDPNNPSYIIDPGTAVSKIFRYYQSGSEFVQDTNGGAGYTVIDPANYNPGGTGSLTAVPGTGVNREWSIQRVFWYPNSATKGIVVYYGSSTYASEVDAAANISYEPFLEVENTRQNAVYLGALLLRNDAVFTDSTTYKVLPGGLFRNVGGSGGGGTAVSTLLSSLTDVTISGPTNGQPLVYNSTLAKWTNSNTLTASLQGNATTATTASYAVTASYLIGSSATSSYALTASYVQNAQTASYVLNAVSSSYALTASYALNVPITSSYALTASYAENAQTASYVLNAVSASRATSAQNADNAATASYWSGSVTNAATASYVQNAQSASYWSGSVTNAATASYVLQAVSSSYATTASYVQNAQSASYWSGSILNAASASYAATASSADDFVVRGTLTAQTIIAQTITSSIDYVTGSTKNGSLLTNTHQFTGSVDITGSLQVNGSDVILTNQTSSMSVSSASYSTTASFANTAPYSGLQGTVPTWNQNTTGTAATASYVLQAVSSSYATNALSASYWSGSIINAETASYVTTAQTASYVTQAQSASYWSGSVTNAATASYVVTAQTASYVTQAQSASYWSGSVLNATSASYANNASNAVTASYALTASYISGSGGGVGFPFSGSAIITGSLLVSQSFVDFTQASYVTGSFTGSLQGTSSFATTASYALITANAPGTTVSFTQSIAATTWSFTHNLNTRNPLLQVYDSTNHQVIPFDIVGTDPTTATIYFDIAESGYAVASNGGGLTVSGSTARLDQTSAAVTWSFAHNLGTRYPNFEIYDSNDYVVSPAGIKAIDNFNAEIYFASASTGKAIANFSGINGAPNATSASYAETASFATNFTVANTFTFDQTLTDYHTIASSIVGTNNMFTKATGSFTSAFFKYTVSSGSNARTGEVMAVWNGSTTQYSDVSTVDIGSTSAVTASAAIVTGQVQFNVITGTSGWKVKSIGTFM